MKESIFTREIVKRRKVDENAYSLIGTELKRIRISQDQTLSSIASDLCSVSYLCKVEKAQIKPNRHMLNEICKRLNYQAPKLNVLFELKDLIKQMINFYYKNDQEKLLEIYEKCQKLENYRSMLISFIYSIANYNLLEAEEIAKELFKLIHTMHNDELEIFLVFYAKLEYYKEDYLEAIENLKLYSIGSNTTLDKIVQTCMLECYIKLNSPMCLVYSNELIVKYLRSSEFAQADYVRYLQGFYMLRNGMYEAFLELLPTISNVTYYKSLELIYDFDHFSIKEEKYYDNLRPYASLIHCYLFNKKEFLTALLTLDKKLYYNCDFSYHILNYLTLSDDEEREAELEEVIIPNLTQTGNSYEANFFLKEMCRISSENGRYKAFCKAFEKLIYCGRYA